MNPEEEKVTRTLALTAKYNQLLHKLLLDPLGLIRNILEDIPEWSNDFEAKFTSGFTKKEKTIHKYFSELATFLKKEGFPATYGANLKNYPKLGYVNRILGSIKRKSKFCEDQKIKERNQQKTFNQFFSQEKLLPAPKSQKTQSMNAMSNNGNHTNFNNNEFQNFQYPKEQKYLEHNDSPSQSMNALSNNGNYTNFNNSEFQNDIFNFGNPKERESVNFYVNEQNSMIRQQTSIQNNNNLNNTQNASFLNHSFQMASESNAIQNNGPNHASNNGRHSKTINGFFNLVQNLWPQVENYLHPERNTGEIVWKDCCSKPTTFCYYEEIHDYDTSKAQTHEGRCGESKDKGKVFLCIDCYFRRFGSEIRG